MRALFRLAIVLTVAAAAVPVLGAPVSAAPPHVAFVQGIPGKSVDVCIGADEVRSGLKYGKWFERNVPSGNRVIRFLSAAAGHCTGRLLARRNVPLAVDDDLTIVGTLKDPKRVLVFDDGNMGSIGQSVAEVYFAFRHAADLGQLTFKIGGVTEIPSPSADPIWVKGDEYTDVSNPDMIAFVSVTRPDSKVPLAVVASHFGSPETIALRQEWYAVGTKPKNARIITFVRQVID